VPLCSSNCIALRVEQSANYRELVLIHSELASARHVYSRGLKVGRSVLYELVFGRLTATTTAVAVAVGPAGN
ncbi:hypothetical protein M5D96_002357, partial [Drosophila gunungcola]